jgi:Rrf2 family transcriptional regulator, iron-sulfur cluster assembly transcription factor
MRVGSKGRYALVALVDVAVHSGNGPVPLADVAARQKISLSYLEQLFAMLRRNGLVLSSRGPGGGYRLERPPAEITIGEVFKAVDETQDGSEPAAGRIDAVTAGLWAALNSHVTSFLDSVSVADVIEGKVGDGQDGLVDGRDGALGRVALS